LLPRSRRRLRRIYPRRDVELAVGDAGGDEGDVAAQLAAIAHGSDVVALLRAEVGDALGEKLGAQAVGLEEGALGKLVAADALGEAEVVSMRSLSLPGRRRHRARR